MDSCDQTRPRRARLLTVRQDLLLIAVFLTTFLLFWSFLAVAVGFPLRFSGLAALGVAFLASGFIVFILRRRLRMRLEHSAFLICPRCRYPLAQVPDGVCPECGSQFDAGQLKEQWQAVMHRPEAARHGR